MKGAISLLTIFLYLYNTLFANAQVKKIYISVSGSDNNTGTFQYPLATLEKAQKIVRTTRINHPLVNVQILLRGGEYLLSNTLQFSPEDGGDSVTSVLYSRYKKEKVYISGGVRLPSKWIIKGKNIWRLSLPEVVSTNWNFRQLFVNSKRLQRATSDSMYTIGPLKEYRNQITQWNFLVAKDLKQNKIGALSSFEYAGKDLNQFDDTSNAEIIVYHSWEASWHNIHKVDTASKSVYLTNPFDYPIGFFNQRRPYRIENCKKYLDKPGEWYLDTVHGELWYYAFPNEKPNSLNFVAPKLEKLINIQGDHFSRKFVRNLNFDGLIFEHTSYPWGVNYVIQKIRKNNASEFPWIDYNKGFTSILSSPECGESILIKSAVNCSFNNCIFTKLGNYAIRIGEYSKSCKIFNCNFNDIGAGGIIIGFNNTNPVANKIPYDMAPSGNLVSDCKITQIGKVHPSGVGISIMQSHHNVIEHNLLFDFPYSGISTGWTWGPSKNFTSYNTIRYNHIYDVMKVMADGAGIYVTGPQPGTLIESNYIHDIGRSNNAVGGANNGLFFDEAAEGITVNLNAIFLIKQQDIRFNKSDESKINLGRNYFEKKAANEQLLNEVKMKVIY